MKDLCIYCDEELVLWERSRSYCSRCQEQAEVAYADDVYYNNNDIHHDDDYIDENEEFRYHHKL
jgi:predicted amidophosphoribosyltransferase